MSRRRVLRLFSVLFVVLLWHIESVHALDITLAWDPNGESNLAGYKVHYGTSAGGPYNGTGSSNGSSPIIVPLSSVVASSPEFTVGNLPNGTYYFVLTAYDAEGLESGYSNQVSASSAPSQYQLSSNVASGNGAISPTSGTYNAGTIVTLMATPASGYRVLSWSGTNNNGSTSTTNTVTMSTNRTVSVSFEPIPNGTPTIASLTVAGQNGSSTVYTNSATRQVSVRLVASDDAALSQYLILDNQSDPTGKTFFNIPGAGQRTADFTISFALNNNDGNRTLYAWVKDAQGVISPAASKPNVVLDRVPPNVALSYSKPNAYKAGDVILLTANFSDSSPIAGIPKISVNYSGTGSDLSGVNMTQASNGQWTYNLTIPSGNDGVATVTVAAADAAGNAAGPPSGNTFTIDNSTPTVVGSPVLDTASYSITITYSEDKMLNAASQASYSFNNGLLLSGNATDVNGDAKVFRLPLNASSFNKFMIYTMTIGANVTDASGNPLPGGGRSFQINDAENDGMADGWEIQWFGSITAKDGTADSDKDGLTDKEEYTYSRQNPSWGWKLNPTEPDSDRDGMPDGFEAKNKLNPTDAADKDLDSDRDGWTNLQEYLEGTNPNDASSSPAAKAPRVKTVKGKKGVLPRQSEIAANDTGFAVLLESSAGIDTLDSSAVTLTIEDGENTYRRDLLQENARRYALVRTAPVIAKGSVVQAASALSADSSVANEVWVVYYRSAETSLSNTWPFSSLVRVSVTARDVDGNAMSEPEVFTFEVESANSHSERVADRPVSQSLLDESGATVVKNNGTLATATFTDDLPGTPYFDKERSLDYPGADAETVTVTLGPHMVFPEGTTVFIPWRKGRTATRGTMAIFGFDGETWQPIVDENGNDLTEGSWVVPGWNNGLSWEIVDDGVQSGVRIKVRHFSSFAGASGASVADTGTPVSGTSAGSSGEGGCFITSIMK